MNDAKRSDSETPTVARVLYRPTLPSMYDAQLTRFTRQFLPGLASQPPSVALYDQLYRASISDLERFWLGVWDFFEVVGAHPKEGPQVLRGETIEDVKWFEGTTCNYAENAFRRALDVNDSLIICTSERSLTGQHHTRSELKEEVRRVAELLEHLGVTRGDRVAGYLPNIFETVVALLACASLGAVWSCCAPEFGSVAVIDRFAQIEPKVLIASDGYVYGGKEFDRRSEVGHIVAALPSLTAVVWVANLAPDLEAPSMPIQLVRFSDNLHGGRALDFAPVSFSDPLWILYSSGTTGLPKPIVQSHGGILLEHLKVLGLQSDLGPASRFLWYTSTGWMMWNFLVGGLLVGSDIVLYDGSPTAPTPEVLWQIVDSLGVTYFGSSAPYLTACRRRGLEPSKLYALDRLQTVGSTGAPLDAETFRWVAEIAAPERAIVSCSGGTDLCTSMLGSSPWHPTLEGRLSTRALGAAVEAYDEDGSVLVGEVGELVITKPMPSMPVALYGDDTRARLHETYFSYFPGVWRHGDWITLYQDGSSVISGRSDSTLNRGGIRMGTAEFYSVVESIAEVSSALVIDTSYLGREGKLLCFVELENRGDSVSSELESEIRRRVAQGLSKRHVPDEIIAVPGVPVTLNGKKLEVPIRKLLLGVESSKAMNRGAVANPEVLPFFLDFAIQWRSQADPLIHE